MSINVKRTSPLVFLNSLLIDRYESVRVQYETVFYRVECLLSQNLKYRPKSPKLIKFNSDKMVDFFSNFKPNPLIILFKSKAKHMRIYINVYWKWKFLIVYLQELFTWDHGNQLTYPIRYNDQTKFSSANERAEEARYTQSGYDNHRNWFYSFMFVFISTIYSNYLLKI